MPIPSLILKTLSENRKSSRSRKAYPVADEKLQLMGKGPIRFRCHICWMCRDTASKVDIRIANLVISPVICFPPLWAGVETLEGPPSI